MELLELRRELKARVDEISEMTVRINMTEKKLETSGRGNLEKIVELEDRLQAMQKQQKLTEKWVLKLHHSCTFCYRHCVMCLCLCVGNTSRRSTECRMIWRA